MFEEILARVDSVAALGRAAPGAEQLRQRDQELSGPDDRLNSASHAESVRPPFQTTPTWR